LIYGASDHGKVVAEAIRAGGAFEILGFLDDDARKWGASIGAFRVLGEVGALADVSPGAFVALGIGSNEERRRLLSHLLERGVPVATVVHPSAVISAGASLGAGTFVGPGAIVHVNARVGRAVIVNSGAIVEHDNVIGDFAHISPNAALGGHVTIGLGAHVGLGAAILPGLSVGSWSRVGAGAAVIAAVPDGTTAVGVPARLVERSRARAEEDARAGAAETTAAGPPPRIHLSAPHMGTAELELVREAFANNWIAPVGPHVDAFEREFCAATGASNAAALSSGTAALHLSMLLAGVGPGDEVMCSSLTFAASANPILYVGARPVFVDCDRATWNMDPGLAVAEIEAAAKRGRPPKALVLVHLYGQCADVDPIADACRRHGVVLIEDAAEALGATYKGRAPGTFGEFGIFSFNGNKIITTSGGGMLVSPDRAHVEKARFFATQARDQAAHYEHSHVGYNYRLSNVLAGIGRGQLLSLGDRVDRRRRVFETYRGALAGTPGVTFMPEAPFGRATRWLTALLIEPSEFGATREEVRRHLDAHGIEARPVWKPMHRQPVFAGFRAVGGAVSDDLFERGLCLPSGSQMTAADLDRVITTFLSTPRQAATSCARKTGVAA